MLSRFAAIERASIDEAYLDLTGSARERLRALRGRPLAAALLPTTFVQGLPDDPGPQPGAKGTHRPGPRRFGRFADRGANGFRFGAAQGREKARGAAPPVPSLPRSVSIAPCASTEGGVLCVPRSESTVNGICVFPAEWLLECLLFILAVGMQLQQHVAVSRGSLMLPVPLLGSARNANVGPLCVPFLEELRQRGLQEWLALLSFDNPDCPDLQLTMGAVIVEEMRVAVEAATGFRCSAGISHNKVCEQYISLTSSE